MKQERGFTFLELIVVVVLVALMASFAVPALLEFRTGAAEKEVARNILSAFRLARSDSIRENLEFRVAFDLETKTVWLERGNRSDGSDDWLRMRGYDPLGFGLSLATGANCTNLTGDGTATADDYLHFNPNGTCGSSGNASSPYICIMSADGQKKYRVGAPFSVTGRAIIQSWSGTEWR